MTSSQLLKQEPSLSALVEMRPTTDTQIPIIWILLPLASYLSWTGFAVAWWSVGAGLGTSELTLLISGLGIIGLTASAAEAYLVFRLVNRVNEHSSRTRALLLSALTSLDARARAPGSPALLPLASAEDSFYKLVGDVREKSAVLWGLLSLIPFVGWIFLAVTQWRLSRDFATHARLESMVLEDVDRTLRSLGREGLPVRLAPVSEHQTLALFLIIVSVIELFSEFLLSLPGALVLMYLTIGAFSLFWIDLSIGDPRGHFIYHSQLEEMILRELPDSTGTSLEVG